MSLLEKCIYSVVSLVFIYVVLSLGLRLFDVTSNYASHMIGGITALVVSVGLFLWLLIKKK